MEIVPVIAGPFETNGYLLNDDTKKGIIIDAPLESTQQFMSLIREKGICVEAIILTHTHWDHTADAAELQRQTGARIYVHSEDIFRLVDPNKFTMMRLPFDIEAVEPNILLKGDEIIEIGEMKLQVVFTPGHTEGGICLYSKDDSVIFTGDTLFNGSIGRYDLPGGSMNVLMQSINERLLVLPDDTKVFCGHGESSTIGKEKSSNPFLMQ